jgi:hypothetical protein
MAAAGAESASSHVRHLNILASAVEGGSASASTVLASAVEDRQLQLLLSFLAP